MASVLIPPGYHRSIVSWTLLLLMLSQNYQYCKSTATLKINFISYKNPTGRDWRNEACDLVFNTACDNLFDICVDRSNGNADVGSCKYLFKSTGEFRNHDDIRFQADMNGVPNPIIINMNKWENILLKVRVRDDDSHSSHDLVDLHFYRYQATPGFNNVENTPSTPLILGRRTAAHSTSLLVKFSVKCNSNYYGSDCTRYCQYTDNSSGHYRCTSNGAKQCLPGWEDATQNCKIRSDDCIGHACLNGAICIDGVRSYRCQCVQGYTGQHCETDIDDCADMPCFNNGTCTDAVNGFSCQCPPEFPKSLSSDCSVHTCTHNDPCENGATCYGDGRCLCPPNYTGLRCEMHFCQSNCIFCQNGGTCTGSECICPPGVFGLRCEVDLCEHVTCLNGGSCINGTCQCPEDYTGIYCHEMVDNCALAPCMNGGFCINKIKGYTCVCTEGYTGPTCDTEKPKPTTEKPEKKENEVMQEEPVVFSEKDLLKGEPQAKGVKVKQEDSSKTLFTVMIICMVFLILIIIVLVLILCKDRINRKRKQLMADRDRNDRMANFDNPVYTVDPARPQVRPNMYDDARYMRPVEENDVNAVRYAETIAPASGGATGTAKVAESLYDYPRDGKEPVPRMDPVYDHPRSMVELQQPPPYSPPLDPHYANAMGGAAAVSMNDLKARHDDEPQYEDIQAIKKSQRKD